MVLVPPRVDRFVLPSILRVVALRLAAVTAAGRTLRFWSSSTTALTGRCDYSLWWRYTVVIYGGCIWWLYMAVTELASGVEVVAVV